MFTNGPNVEIELRSNQLSIYTALDLLSRDERIREYGGSSLVPSRRNGSAQVEEK